MKWKQRLLASTLRYPAIGVLVSLVIPVGYLIAEILRGGAPVLGDSDHLFTVGYLAGAAAAVLALVAWVFGRREARLRVQSEVDPLTGLANRRHFLDVLSRELRRSMRTRDPLTLLMIDVDNLKVINDRHGHATGDRALRIVAECITGVARSTDLCARLGGDEFVVLLPATAGVRGLVVADRLRVALAEHGNNLSTSIGVVDTESLRGATIDSLLEAADGELYVAKRSGGDRAVLHQAAPVGHPAAKGKHGTRQTGRTGWQNRNQPG